MDPNKVQLTTVQKIKPLLKAINDEFPWQFILILALSLTFAIILPTYIPVFIEPSIADFLVRRLVIGFMIGLVTFFIGGFAYMFIVEKIMPIFTKINKHYQEYALEEKKKILENVIEDEVLGVEK